jgi:hypothetical protein
MSDFDGYGVRFRTDRIQSEDDFENMNECATVTVLCSEIRVEDFGNLSIRSIHHFAGAVKIMHVETACA